MMPLIVPAQRYRFSLRLNLSVGGGGTGELRLRNPAGSGRVCKLEGVTVSSDLQAIAEVAHLPVDGPDYATAVSLTSREPRISPRQSVCVGSQQNNGALSSPGLQRFYCFDIAAGIPHVVPRDILPEYLFPGNMLIPFASGPAGAWNMYATISWEELDIAQ